MKTLVILEGIASSGKTTVSTLLKEALAQRTSVRVFTEEETLMDIVDDRSFETANQRLGALLEAFRSAEAQVIITDRYHLTHLFRTEKEFSSFRAIEDVLVKEFNTHIFLLTLDEEQIGPRVQDAWDRRGIWLGKAGTLEEKVAYYSDQQRQIRRFASESLIPVVEINTTKKDWPQIVQTIAAVSGLA